jgi:LPS export ABC transporter protein LptC
MSKKRFWLVAIGVFILVCGIIIFWLVLRQTLSSQKTVRPAVNDKQLNFDEAEGVIMKVPGKTQNTYWELHIHQIESLGDIDNINHIEGTYYVDKKPFYQMSGKTGVIYLTTRVIQVNGNVVLRTIDASKELDTDELIWDSQLDRIKARRGAILKTPQVTVTTNEIVSNLKLDHAIFNGPTKVSYQRVNHD